jgi:hypothetical protein
MAATVTPGDVVLEITAPLGAVTVMVVVPLALMVVTVVSLDVLCAAPPVALLPDADALPAAGPDETGEAADNPLADPIPADATASMALMILSASLAIMSRKS